MVGFRASERVALACQADDLSVAYSYPGLTAALQPAPFTTNVAAIKVAVEKLVGVTFNSCHLNLYRCGADHVSWHTDEDCELCVRLGSHRSGSTAALEPAFACVCPDGEAPCIASVSFGEARDFMLRRMQGAPYTDEWKPVVPPQMVRYALRGGSLLVMSGTTQRHW